MSEHQQRRNYEERERLRRSNLRQLILAASRAVNSQIVQRLGKTSAGHLLPTHTRLLANLPMAGARISDVAERAGMTSQAMGRLASELEAQGLINVTPDPNDGRAKRLVFTESGEAMMNESFKIMAEIEREISNDIGDEELTSLKANLHAVIQKYGA